MTEKEIEIRKRIAKDRTEYRDTTLTLQESHIVMNALWKLEGFEADNVALRERLGKAVELPRIIHPNKTEWHIQYQNEYGIIFSEIKFSKEAAEARLAELKGETK